MGKYQLVRRLATGGMAEVFLAKAAGPMGFEKELVVKRILPHLAEDPKFVEMFLTEAKLAARLNHGNVVQIFDFGEQEDAYFIAMEYVQGLNLKVLAKRALQRGTPIPYPLIARIVSQACEGLAYAHELVDPESEKPMGFIHRDISTDNILVSLTGGVKVVDFGIAKAANVGQQTQGGVIKGKMAYMPPEYLQGFSIDSRADIYALGVVLYELVAGRKPFVAETEVQLAQFIVHAPMVDVRTLRTDVPEPLVQVMERALHKDRNSRYASCRQFQADLERFLFQCGEPVSALQIAEWVKALAAMDPSPARRSSTELPAVSSSPAPATGQATRSLRPPNVNAAPPPLVEDTVVTPLPTTLVMENDEELLRLVARPGWHKYVAIAVGALILGGVGFVSFSENTPHSSETGPTASEAQGATPEQARPAPVANPPPPNAQAWQVPGVGIPSSEQAVASMQRPNAPPEEEPAKPAAELPSAGATSSTMATLKVHSSLSPYRIWIDTRELKNPHALQFLKPGSHNIEVNGKTSKETGGKRFHKIERVVLQIGPNPDKSVDFLYIPRLKIDAPVGMTVIAVDDEKPDNQNRVDAYDGLHSLKLRQTSTGKSYLAECFADAKSKVCKLNERSLVERR